MPDDGIPEDDTVAYGLSEADFEAATAEIHALLEEMGHESIETEDAFRAGALTAAVRLEIALREQATRLDTDEGEE